MILFKKIKYVCILYYFIFEIFFKNLIYTNNYYVLHLIKTLWIGTLNIHPPLFYIFILLFVINSFWTNFYLNKFTKIKLIKYLSLTLFLGGLWGLQSLTWGYIWANDGIEWILFLIIFQLIFCIHSIRFENNVINILFSVNILLYFLILIRLNLITTRHSFLSNYNLNFFVYSLYVNLYLISLNVNKWKNLNYCNSLQWWNLCIMLNFFFNKFFINWIILLYFNYFFFFFILYYYKISSPTIRYFHFFLFIFVFFWKSFYNSFFLFYKINFFTLHNYYIYSKTILFENLYWHKSNSIELLEKVDFFINNNSISGSFLIKSFSKTLIFLNWFCLLSIFIIVLFLKGFEFRLLY